MGSQLAAANTLTARLLAPEDFDAPANGKDDDSAAFSAAMAHLSSNGGGTLYLSPGRRYLCKSGISIPDNCGIDGGLSSPGFVAGINYIEQGGSLLLAPDASIVLGSSAGLRNLRILNTSIAYPCPATEQTARAQVKSFSGTAIIDAENSADRHLENMMVIGFAQALKFVSTQGRSIIRDFRFDCTNGIEISNSQDVDLLDGCHANAYYMQTRHMSWNAIYRDGAAFSFHNSQDGPFLTNCFEIGYKFGYVFAKTLSPQLTNCNCDGAADLSLTGLTGMQFTEAGNVSVFGGTISAQSRAVSIISGGQHAFVAATIGNQAVARDGYLLRAAGGSIGRVIGCFFTSSRQGREMSPISLVNKAGNWTVSQTQFIGFSAPTLAVEAGVPPPNFSGQGNMVITR
jgi:hypothetical protein